MRYRYINKPKILCFHPATGHVQRWTTAADRTEVPTTANYSLLTAHWTYTYDNLYRLTHATGWWECRPDHLTLRDTVDMRYSKNGRIIRKRMSAETLKNMQLILVRYDRQYQYPSVYSNKVNSVTDAMSGTSHQFEWESGGNLMRHANPDSFGISGSG